MILQLFIIKKLKIYSNHPETPLVTKRSLNKSSIAHVGQCEGDWEAIIIYWLKIKGIYINVYYLRIICHK